MYNNPENISLDEILKKINLLSFGGKYNSKVNPNKIIRFRNLCGYSHNIISKEEWIKKYCRESSNFVKK